MPDSRKHRGAHPEDRELFAPETRPALAKAVADLSWLLSRGYAEKAATKTVGDRYALCKRQRLAVQRCACSDEALANRARSLVVLSELAAEELWVDGFNLLITIETALAGGVVLEARDGCLRDMASMHGSYRKVEETVPALEIVGSRLADLDVGRVVWLLDSPVSNSGRLKGIMQKVAAARSWPWEIQLCPDPDKVLRGGGGGGGGGAVVATADSVVLDNVGRWCNLARSVVESCVPDAWLLDLSGRNE